MKKQSPVRWQHRNYLLSVCQRPRSQLLPICSEVVFVALDLYRPLVTSLDFPWALPGTALAGLYVLRLPDSVEASQVQVLFLCRQVFGSVREEYPRRGAVFGYHFGFGHRAQVVEEAVPGTT